MSSYDTDLCAWTKDQADALRRRAANELDWDNLAEEIESLGNSNRRELRARIEVLILHLLRGRYQPERQSGGWRGSIREARDRLEDLLDESPSLRRRVPEYLPKAYERACEKALDQTGLYRLAGRLPVDDRADSGPRLPALSR